MSHSRMVGQVTAMEPAAFQTWLAGGKVTGTMADLGAQVFNDLGCATCHMDTAQGRGPSLRGVFGHEVTLANGQKVTADEAYVRESILVPTAKMVAGYPPLMPTFQGVVSEEQIAQLTAYIKSLAPAAGTPAAPGSAPGAAPGAAPAAPSPTAPGPTAAGPAH
jgi:cytochrome c oxidase subunit 2